MQLIEAGCDINIVDSTRRTALHKAISEQNVDITRELIKRGGDVNARSCNRTTPLFHAIDTGNLEIFCMLLCYGADATIFNENGLTALTHAMQRKESEMAQLLIPYYDNFNYTDKYNNSVLYIAVRCNRILAVELLELGADVNGINNSDIEFIMMENDTELFKKIWSKLDYQILLNFKKPLLIYCLDDCRLSLPTSKWLECVYLILGCPIALDYIQHFICYYYNNIHQFYEHYTFFYFLISVLNERNISSSHITNMISICLSLGVNVKLGDLDTAIHFLGFQEDFEMLLYATGNFIEYNFICIWCPFLPVILGMEDFNIKTVMKNLERNIRFIIKNSTFNCIGFFSISHSAKLKLFKRCSTSKRNLNCQKVLEKINRIPEFPTLFELSRNQAHKFIRQTYKMKKPYHFQDAVKRLCLPQYIKDVIRFKIPIYR